jgi:hypothetical protein
MRARLLDIDVLARLASPDGGQRVPVIGRRDADGVDLLVVEHAAQVLLNLHRLAIFVEEFQGPLVGHVAVRIAQDGHLGVGLALKAFDMVLAAAVYTQHSDADLIVRRGLAGAEIHCQRSTSAHHETPSATHLEGFYHRYVRIEHGRRPQDRAP